MYSKKFYFIKNRKGQVISIDLIVGISIFLILLTLCILVWSQTVYRMEQRKILYEMQNNLMLALDMLIKTKGVPSSWERNPNSLIALGLAYDDRTLSKDKVDAFMNLVDLDYNASKKYLGILKYDYRLRLLDLNGEVLNDTRFRSVGLDPVGDFKITVSRLVNYNGNLTNLELTIFSKYSLEHMSQPFL